MEGGKQEVEAGRRNVIGRARFVYLFAWQEDGQEWEVGEGGGENGGDSA